MVSERKAVTYGWGRQAVFVAKKVKGWERGLTLYDNTAFQNVWLDR